MSSSQPFVSSSPLPLFAGSTHRRKSKFTYKHLSQFGMSSTACPLRIIAHIDLDAFYAQCEMVRLNVPEDQPLAVQVSAGAPCTIRKRSGGNDGHTAMARAHSNQLPGEELRVESTHYNHGSEEALSKFDHAACGNMEGRRREVGVPRARV